MQAFIRAAFKELRALRDSIVPALELEFEITLSRAGPGEALPLPDNYLQVWIPAIQGFLFWSPTAGDIASGFIATGLPGPLFYSSGLRDDSQALLCTVVFPMTAETVARIENLRKGKDPVFRAYFRFSGFVQAMQGHVTPTPAFKGETALTQSMLSHDTAGVPFVIHRLHFTDSTGNQQPIKIAKSTWVEHILPGLGFGVWKTYEIPVAEAPALGKVDDYIDQAAKNFNTGEWKDSLARSRDAIQTLEPMLKKHGNPVYSDQKGGPMEEKFDEMIASFSNLASGMLDFQAKVFSLLSAGAHPESAGTAVERADAELGLTVALACRRYVGVRMLPGKP